MLASTKIETFRGRDRAAAFGVWGAVMSGAAALGLTAGLLPSLAQAQTGLVALVHTQAAGDSGPVDSMIGKLKQLASEKGFEYRAVYASDPATYESIFRTLGDAGAASLQSGRQAHGRVDPG